MEVGERRPQQSPAAQNYLTLGRTKEAQNLPLLCILQIARKPQQEGYLPQTLPRVSIRLGQKVQWGYKFLAPVALLLWPCPFVGGVMDPVKFAIIWFGHPEKKIGNSVSHDVGV